MFTKQTLNVDTQLSPDQLANLLVADAIAQLQQSTQLSSKKCEKLITRQLVSTSAIANKPVIDSQETSFITGLFN